MSGSTVEAQLTLYQRMRRLVLHEGPCVSKGSYLDDLTWKMTYISRLDPQKHMRAKTYYGSLVLHAEVRFLRHLKDIDEHHFKVSVELEDTVLKIPVDKYREELASPDALDDEHWKKMLALRDNGVRRQLEDWLSQAELHQSTMSRIRSMLGRTT